MSKGARTRQCGAACIIVRGKTPFDPDIIKCQQENFTVYRLEFI